MQSLGYFKRQAMYVHRNIQVRWCKHCCSGKAIIITYSECVFVVLVTQHAMRMQHIVICGLLGSAKWVHIVQKKERFSKKKKKKDILFNIRCISIFCTKVVWNISHFKNWARYDKENVCRSSCTVPVILVRPQFSQQIFGKIEKCQISRKSVQRGLSCSLRTDGQTIMTKLIVALRHFAEVPKKQSSFWRLGTLVREVRTVTGLCPYKIAVYHKQRILCNLKQLRVSCW